VTGTPGTASVATRPPSRLGSTMATYQHLVPGMSAAAAVRFADLMATA
jgi:hypothetical protein